MLPLIPLRTHDLPAATGDDLGDRALLRGVKENVEYLKKRDDLIRVKDSYKQGPENAEGSAGKWRLANTKQRVCCFVRYVQTPAWVLDAEPSAAFLENGERVDLVSDSVAQKVNSQTQCIMIVAILVAFLAIAGVAFGLLFGLNAGGSD